MGEAGVYLAGGKLPGLPPQAGLPARLLPGGGEAVEEARQALVQRRAQAARAGAELGAQPGILVVGIDQQVIHVGEVAGEDFEQQHVAVQNGVVGDAVGRGVAVGHVVVVGGAEVEEGAQAQAMAGGRAFGHAGAAALAGGGGWVAVEGTTCGYWVARLGGSSTTSSRLSGSSPGRGPQATLTWMVLKPRALRRRRLASVQGTARQNLNGSAELGLPRWATRVWKGGMGAGAFRDGRRVALGMIDPFGG